MAKKTKDASNNPVATKVDYQDLIVFLQKETGYSYFKTRTIIKELSRLLLAKVHDGVSIECPGLFKVTYTITGYNLATRSYFGLVDQAKSLARTLDMSFTDVLAVLNIYYGKIKASVESGYRVNIKSIGYLRPVERDGSLMIDVRHSPQLSVPEVADFLVVDSNGMLMVKEFDRLAVRLSIVCDTSLHVPYSIQSGQQGVGYLETSEA